jgi:hypothetical protein
MQLYRNIGNIQKQVNFRIIYFCVKIQTLIITIITQVSVRIGTLKIKV